MPVLGHQAAAALPGLLPVAWPLSAGQGLHVAGKRAPLQVWVVGKQDNPTSSPSFIHVLR